VTFPAMPVPLPAGQTPYVTADQLLSGMWPTGVSWASLPPGRTATDAQKYAAVSTVCAEGTAECDGYCNLPLRCTSTAEIFHGPGDSDARVTIQNGSGMGRIVLQRLPVLQITQVQVAPSRVFPRQWTTVPAGCYEPEYPALGLYNSIAPSAGGQGGQAILVAPPYISWSLGRNGYVIQVSYTHGWPHASLTAAAQSGASVISVDDCTGWGITTQAGTGAAGVAYDSGLQEAVKCNSASVLAGPGTLTLASPLLYSHNAGVMVSSFPQDIIWASALFSSAAALTRGATSTTLQEAPGRGAAQGTGEAGAGGLAKAAMAKLKPYRRTV
jgi:hypothetical protein